MADKFCSACGTANRVSAHFCIQCGHAFQRLHTRRKFCPRCGTPQKDSARFCPQCGYRWNRLTDPIPPEPPIQQTAPVGIVLPPEAELPLLDEDDSLQETQIDPASAINLNKADPLERKGGQTGIILTEEELERLRQQPDRPLFIYTPKSNKRR